jgi:hypothetical protein
MAVPDVTRLQPETGFSSSRDRARHPPRARNKYGLFPRRLLVSRTQLDKLEERGYLDPDLRGNQADEADAIEAAYWFVSVGEQPSIQPSVSWIARSSFEPASISIGRQNSHHRRLSRSKSRAHCHIART